MRRDHDAKSSTLGLFDRRARLARRQHAGSILTALKPGIMMLRPSWVQSTHGRHQIARGLSAERGGKISGADKAEILAEAPCLLRAGGPS